ncbi:YqaJ viral recombinase family protein [Variovorax sp. EBFNA2]|uniref:YqaJ viral recombinase family nuclease n=1 Tax=Variovorax sp. EBFNA2 TaxID=3342097 RepID=UPI0029C08B6D|nr:YqaJ viral recombinase family protein [Variovorax boronicumulans]WPG38838.1 YqaJ viral recombinase family protein [Variovorax boronicumulans]
MNSTPRNTQRSPSTRVRSRAPALRLVPSTCSQAPISERWPSAGEAGIGSLDAAAAIGRDPFKSPVRLWMEKTERHDLLQPVAPCLVQSADTAAYWSRLLEPIVAAHYALRTGRQVLRTRALLRHPQHPWMLAHPGREIVGAPDVQLLECRCVGMGEAELWGAGLPDCVRIQMLHRLAVANAQALDVVALICGQDLRIHRVERDELEISRLIDAEREFWHCVQTDCAPLAGDREAV